MGDLSMKHVTLEGGIKVGVFEKPPSDIDPFTASPAELRKYGLPPVPDHPRHRERYQRLFGQIRHKLTFVEPAFRVNPDRFPLRGREGGILIGAETFASPTTSGTFVVAPPGDSIRWMQGDWVVPNVSAPTQEGEYFCAFWIGIGGTGGAAFQAGVHLSVSGSNRQLFPFWEWLSQGGQGQILDITNFAVRPGDLISVILCTAQGAGSADGTVYFFNRTTGGHTSVATSGPPVAALTAEWSVGFPFLWGGDASILADYGEVFFAECQAVTNAFTLIDGGNGNNVNITSDGTANGTVVSESISITDTIVQCLYV
jgi:hypothetical protein